MHYPHAQLRQFMKEILSNMRKLEENETIILIKECSVIQQTSYLLS